MLFRVPHAAAALAAVLTVFGCSDGAFGPIDLQPGPDVACAPTAGVSPTTPELALEPVHEGLRRPATLAFAPGDPRFYVTEQYHGVKILEPDGTPLPDLFIDLEGQVSTDFEQGVLGLAFDPDFEASGFVYLTYTDLADNLHLARFRVVDDTDQAELHSTLLVVPQSSTRHQGGQIAFGPDGMLYVALGDASYGFDEDAHGQDPGTLPASLLRIDVSGGVPYRIPPDNPFVSDGTARDEVWAYGLRNPWSISFDTEGGCLYVTDVGEAHREEVNAVQSDVGGLNFGWSVMEGFDCFQNMGDQCDKTGLVRPVLDYPRGDTCISIIGGHVYRGSGIPGLQGAYIYADFCYNWIRSFRLDDNLPVEEEEWTFPDLENPVHFGRDPAGEIYVLTMQGMLYKLVEG